MPALSLVPHAARTALAVACALALMTGAQAQVPPRGDDALPAPAAEAASGVAAEPFENSTIDAPLFYQLLIGEMELRSGEVGTAYQVLLDAARKTRDPELFRRATEIALQARAGDQALAAAQAWRSAIPDSVEAMGYQVRLLIALNRQAEADEPLRAMLAATPAAERAAMIASLPRLFARATDKTQTATQLQTLLEPEFGVPETRAAARVAIGRAWLAAGDAKRAFELAQQAHSLDRTAEGPALLALELLTTGQPVEPLIADYLDAQPKSSSFRLLYARVLNSAQRYADAVPQLEAVTRAEPQLPTPWLTLGALHLELRHPKEAQAALTQYVQRAGSGSLTQAPAPVLPGGDDDDDEAPPTADQGLVQAYLLLSQAAEQQRDYAGAEAWLKKVDSPQRALEVQTRRASLLARQGKVKDARELIRRAPEKTTEDARAKLLAEAQILRDVKQWNEANTVLAKANQRFPNDPDLLYEQSMMAEKLNRMDEMERLLRRVIELKPDHHHAYNALGYSLAERNQRLPEARDLIRKALDLAPGEPFITDSLGWVEYRLGNRPEALRLLQQAYRSRPDVEIAAHLGELLWISGQRDEARKVLRDARTRDNANDVLKETLARLRVDL
jgi:tetratricopeptide (TPR) repeat protein